MTGSRDLTARILLALSSAGHRVFRHNVGVGWVGKSTRFNVATTVHVLPGDVVIRNARPLHAGLVKGGSDVIGWSSTGRFLAVEVKYGDDRESLEQQNFRWAVNGAGGIAIVAHDVEQAVDDVSSRIVPSRPF